MAVRKCIDQSANQPVSVAVALSDVDSGVFMMRCFLESVQWPDGGCPSWAMVCSHLLDDVEAALNVANTAARR